MKRFVSLSAAIMLGTVLSKDHSHVAKKIAKVEKPKNKESILPNKKKADSLDENRVKVHAEKKREKIRKAYESPFTSVESKDSENYNNNEDISSTSPAVNQLPRPVPPAPIRP